MSKFKLIWKDKTETIITGDFISNTLERLGYTIKQLKRLKKWETIPESEQKK
jgi:hypothetical protein